MKDRLMSLFLTSFKRMGIRQSVMAFASCLALNSIVPAQAAIPHDVLLPADELDLSVPCVETHLSVDRRLKSGLIIKAIHGAVPSMAQGKDGAQSRLSLSYEACPQGASLSVVLSPNTTLTVHDSSEAVITEEGPLAALEINLQDGSLTADTIESLDMAANGASHIKIHQLDRAAQIAAVETSDIKIDQVNLTAFSATMAGTSTLHINSGLINVVTLFLSNQSKAEIHASIGKAGVTANDQSTVKIGPLLGALMPRGSGTVETIEKDIAPEKKTSTPKDSIKKGPTPEEQKEAQIAAETKAFLHNDATPAPASVPAPSPSLSIMPPLAPEPPSQQTASPTQTDNPPQKVPSIESEPKEAPSQTDSSTRSSTDSSPAKEPTPQSVDTAHPPSEPQTAPQEQKERPTPQTPQTKDEETKTDSLTPLP